MSAVLEKIDQRKYRKLIATALPRVIHTEEENEKYIAQLEALHRRKLTPEEEQLAELLTLLIENFEERHYQLDASSPIDVLRELMSANDLNQSDLIDVFGTASVISEVLNGKRDLSKSHIQKLCQRFHISSELFFPSAG